MLQFNLEESEAMFQELQLLDEVLQKKALSYILGQAVAPAVKAIKKAAPVGEGSLKAAMGRKKLNKRERRAQSIGELMGAVGIGATRKSMDTISVNGHDIKKKQFQDYKLRFLEEGTKRHSLYKGNKNRAKAMFKKVYLYGRWIRLSTISHPGTRKNPFMTREYMRHERLIPGRTITALQKWLTKNASRQLT